MAVLTCFLFFYVLCLNCVQYLSKKNIKVFLDTCRLQFGLKDADLFEIPDLFDGTNFVKVRLIYGDDIMYLPLTFLPTVKALMHNCMSYVLKTARQMSISWCDQLTFPMSEVFKTKSVKLKHWPLSTSSIGCYNVSSSSYIWPLWSCPSIA